MERNMIVAAVAALVIGGIALFFLKGGGPPGPPGARPTQGRLWTQEEVDMSNEMTRIEERNKFLLGK